MKHLLSTSFRTIAGALLCACCSFCAEDADEGFSAVPEGVRPAGKTEIRLALPQALTRTELTDDNGTTAGVIWSDGDRIALWAAAGNEAFALKEALFTHTDHIDDIRNELFTGTIDPMVPGTNYTDYSVHPAPAAVEGELALLDIPAVQDGAYNSSAADILWGCTTEPHRELGAALYEKLDLPFEHKTHALKITLGTLPFEEGVTALQIHFGQPVAGRLAVDIRTGAATLTEEGASNSILVAFSEPKHEGDCFWVHTAPDVELTGQTVQFVATDGTEYTYPSRTTGFATLEAGHITPVALPLSSIREQMDYTIAVTDHSHLGEAVTGIAQVTLPEGYVFPGLALSPTTGEVQPAGSERFVVKMYADEAERLARSGLTQIGMLLESEHAENLDGDRGYHPVNDLTASGFTTVAPYLFFEDFSGVSSYEYYSDFQTTGDTENRNPISLEPYGLSQWTGTRVGMSEGVGLRIMSKVEIGLYIINRMSGRVESAPMARLKPDAQVDVRASFNYSGARYNGAGGNSGDILMSVGYDSYSATSSGIIATKDLDNPVITNETVPIDNTGNTTHYGNTIHEKTVPIPACTSDTRLCWQVSNNRGTAMAANGSYWLYIDDVRVSIAAE